MIIFVLIFVLLLVCVVTWLLINFKRERDEFLPSKVANIHYDKETQKLTFNGGVSGQLYSFFGSGTVWHTEDGRRLNTLWESRLTDIMARFKIEENNRLIEKREKIFSELHSRSNSYQSPFHEDDGDSDTILGYDVDGGRHNWKKGWVIYENNF